MARIAGATLVAASLGAFGPRAASFASETRSRGMGDDLFSAATAVMSPWTSVTQAIEAPKTEKQKASEAWAAATGAQAGARATEAQTLFAQQQAQAERQRSADFASALSDLTSAVDSLRQDANAVFTSARSFYSADPNFVAAARAATDAVGQLIQVVQASWPSASASPDDVRLLAVRVHLAAQQVQDVGQQLALLAPQARASATQAPATPDPVLAWAARQRVGMGDTSLVGGIFGGLFQAIGQIGSSIPAIEAASGLKSAQTFAGQQATLKALDLQNQKIAAEAKLAESQGTGAAASVGAWAPWAAIGVGGLALAAAFGAAFSKRRRTA